MRFLGSHKCKGADGLTGFGSVLTRRSMSTFEKNIFFPSSGLI